MNFVFGNECARKSCTINHHRKLLSGDSEYDFHGADKISADAKKKIPAHSRVSINHYFGALALICFFFISFSLRFIKLYSRWQQRIFFSLLLFRGHHLSSQHISTAQCHICASESFSIIRIQSSKLYE